MRTVFLFDIFILSMMSMNNIPQTSVQPLQRFLSEQAPTTMTLVPSSTTVGDY